MRDEEEAAAERLRRFSQWMKSNGIEHSNALQFGVDEMVSGTGVRALRDLPQGEVIATMPKSACLTLLNTAARDAIEKAELGGGLGLSVALMYELSKGKDSRWYGYLEILPRQENVPFLWSDDEIDRLFRGTELYKTLKEDKVLMKEDWEENIAPLTKDDPVEFPAQHFTFECYLSAKSLVSSRAFEVDEEHGYGMVPLADLFNHKTMAEDVHFMSNCDGDDDDDDDDEDEAENKSVDRDFLEMMMVKDVAAGSEIFNTYGDIGNAALLHRYGFTEPDNPCDIVNLDMEIVAEVLVPRFEKKLVRRTEKLWRKAGFSGCESQGCEYFEISAAGKLQIELLLLIFLIQSPDEACKKLDDAAAEVEGSIKAAARVLGWRKNNTLDSSPGSQPSKKQKLRNKLENWLLNPTVADLLLQMIEKREQLYGDEDRERRTSREIHAATLRAGEQKILRDCKHRLKSIC